MGVFFGGHQPPAFSLFVFFLLPLGKTSCWRIKFGQWESSEADSLEAFFFCSLPYTKRRDTREEQMDGFQTVPVPRYRGRLVSLARGGLLFGSSVAGKQREEEERKEGGRAPAGGQWGAKKDL